MKENTGPGGLRILTTSRQDLKKSYSNLFDPNEESESRSNLSLDDIEDLHIDFARLASGRLYRPGNLPYAVNHLIEAEVVVEEIIRKIKKESTFLLIENHIKAKLPGHSSTLCLEILDLIVNMTENGNCISEQEKEKALRYSEDEEPESSRPDSWVRGKMGTQRKEERPVDMLNFAEIERSIMGIENQRSLLVRVNEKAASYINEIKEKHPPQPIDLSERVRVNEVEEDLRTKKEHEQRIAIEKKEKERMEDNKIKTQQIELAKMAKEQKAKNFTYDYDGKVILVHGLKNEKFPPATYLIKVKKVLYSFAFSQEWPPMLSEEEKKKLKKKKAQEMLREARSIQKHRKTPEEEKEFVKNIMTVTPPIYDQFTLAPGVTLTMNGKLKVEPRPITATIANITDPLIRMSKTDYFNLTRTGNLSREGLSKTQDAGRKLSITQKLGKISEEQSYQSGISKDVRDRKEKKGRTEEKVGEVRVTNPMMVDTMTRPISEEDEFEFIRRQQEDHRRRMEELEAKREKSMLTSPVDKFNLDIISSKDWGRSTLGVNLGANMQKPASGKPTLKELNQTLGNMKKPRERLVGNQGGSMKRLPPPMVGRTIGHGFANTLSQETLTTNFKLPENI